jgi:hypothetical protein
MSVRLLDPPPRESTLGIWLVAGIIVAWAGYWMVMS